jgi:uncharacterized protein (DUF58 family)
MKTDPRIHVTLDHLRNLQGAARGLSFLPKQPSASVLNGRHVSRLRGRGLNFEEMRDYLPGDDIRSIDWKATARTGKPHVRVFTEERDRPALLVVDQRMSMFFGTVLNMKSVCAAEAAAIMAFRILKQGDRVGGVVFDEQRKIETPPRRSLRSVYSFLSGVSTMNCALHANKQVASGMAGLNSSLDSVARLAHHDHLVVVFSDFEGIDGQTRKKLSGIAAHNDLILVLVHDPAARNMISDEKLILGDGILQAEMNFGASVTRDLISAFNNDRLDRILRWQEEINLSVLPLNCGQDTLAQMRARLASLAPGRRVR